MRGNGIVVRERDVWPLWRAWLKSARSMKYGIQPRPHSESAILMLG